MSLCVFTYIFYYDLIPTACADVLNRLAPIKLLANGDVPSKDNIAGRDERHVLKHIFPRQFGLRHPFDATHDRPGTGFKFEDYSVREQEIQVGILCFVGPIGEWYIGKVKGNVKTPKRLKTVLDLVQQLIKKHWACNYRAIRSTVCPSKVFMVTILAMLSFLISSVYQLKKARLTMREPLDSAFILASHFSHCNHLTYHF